jgi:hypothetical protein
MHLVSNAAKFTKNGAIRISGARSSADGRVRLAFTVADNGIGIGPRSRRGYSIHSSKPMAMQTGASKARGRPHIGALFGAADGRRRQR